jgi:hypothetical protein
MAGSAEAPARDIARSAVLVLFVVFLGVALGAGLYESRVEVPQWIEQTDAGYRWNAEAAREADTGRRFWAFVTTGPLTVLSLASLVLAWRSTGALRRWWLAAAGVSLADRVLTFSYFIPTMLVLMSDPGPDGQEAVDVALRWAALDWVRHGLTLAALLAALRALTLMTDRTSAVAASVR